MRTRFGFAAALTMTSALAAAGCGSSDDGPSKAEFVKQADALCAKGDKQIAVVAKKSFSGGQPSKTQVVAFVKDTAVPKTREEVHAIKKLDPPKGDEDKVNAITDAADAGLQKLESNPALGAQQGAADPLAKASKLAKAYGLKKCGSG